MKNNYTKIATQLLVSLIFTFGATTYGQDIHFTFANAQNTNDGSNDFYEVDVMMQTINSTGTFKLGSGQLYFDYNTAAFGSSISASGGIEVTYTNPNYICGQFVDAGAANIYGSFVDNDNTSSKVSWSFAQAFSSSTFAADNVTATPTMLAHLKIQYTDVLEDPMVTYEDGAAFDDQFFTACGSAGGGPFVTADCSNFPGMQLLNDTFDSTGSVLSDQDIELQFDFSVYPNPTSNVINIESTATIDSVELFDLLGKQVLTSLRTEQIRVNHLPAGVYILRVYSDNGNLTKKVIIE